MKKDTIHELISQLCDLYWIPYFEEASIVNGNLSLPLFGMKEKYVLKHSN